jgi:hypothetical protein
MSIREKKIIKIKPNPAIVPLRFSFPRIPWKKKTFLIKKLLIILLKNPRGNLLVIFGIMLHMPQARRIKGKTSSILVLASNPFFM